MRALTWLLFASVVLAGCAGPEPEVLSTPAPTAVAPAAPAEYSETTGALVGTVTDDEQVPLPGVVVGVQELGTQTTTDLAGQFTFSNVAPGRYSLQFALLGYSGSAKSIEVVAGEVASTVAVLSRIVVDIAYHYTLQQKGLLGCAFQTEGVPTGLPFGSPGVSVCGIGQVITLITGQDTSGVDKFRTVWELTDPSTAWNTTVLEMVWQSTQALGAGLSVIWEVDLCSGDPDLTFAGPVVGRSPLIARTDAERIQAIVAESSKPNSCLQQGLVASDTTEICNADKCDIQARVFSDAETTGQAVDVGASIQQTFEQFMTNFYYAPAPPEFTALTDA